MNILFLILFFTICWAFIMFWTKILHEYDLLFNCVADKTAKISNGYGFFYRTCGQWLLQIKIMKIFALIFIINISIFTQIFIVVTILEDMGNLIFNTNLILSVICLILLIVVVYFTFRYFIIFFSVYIFGINHIEDNNKNSYTMSKLKKKSIDFIKSLDIKRPYPSNKMIMNYEMRKLSYNWDTIFTGKFDILVGYYGVLFITISLLCVEIIVLIIVGHLKF